MKPPNQLPLSLAMRIGAQRRPQVFGITFSMIENKDHCAMQGSCAIGAVMEEMGEIPNLQEPVKHPVASTIYALDMVIVSLNDDYKWPRERIADWLASIGF